MRLQFASPVNTINGNIINGPNRPATCPTDFSFFSPPDRFKISKTDNDVIDNKI